MMTFQFQPHADPREKYWIPLRSESFLIIGGGGGAQAPENRKSHQQVRVPFTCLTGKLAG